MKGGSNSVTMYAQVEAQIVFPESDGFLESKFFDWIYEVIVYPVVCFSVM